MEERAWAAGFYDGEGCTHTQRIRWNYPSPKNRLKEPHAGAPLFSASLSQVDPRSLLRFQNAVGGYGRISGPHRNGPGKARPIYHYRAHGDDARRVIAGIWPWLGEIKRQQALEQRRAYRVAKQEHIARQRQKAIGTLVYRWFGKTCKADLTVDELRAYNRLKERLRQERLSAA